MRLWPRKKDYPPPEPYSIELWTGLSPIGYKPYESKMFPPSIADTAKYLLSEAYDFLLYKAYAQAWGHDWGVRHGRTVINEWQLVYSDSGLAETLDWKPCDPLDERARRWNVFGALYVARDKIKGEFYPPSTLIQAHKVALMAMDAGVDRNGMFTNMEDANRANISEDRREWSWHGLKVLDRVDLAKSRGVAHFSKIGNIHDYQRDGEIRGSTTNINRRIANGEIKLPDRTRPRASADAKNKVESKPRRSKILHLPGRDFGGAGEFGNW